MQFIIDLVPIFFQIFLQAMYWPMFVIVTYIVFMQHRKFSNAEKKLYGKAINNTAQQVILSIVQGILGGLLASMALVLLGLSLQQIGLVFIWPIAILLLLFNPRYLCFSYAGGIVAALSLLARHIIVPMLPHLSDNIVIEALLHIHIPALLVLIGLLHLIEAFLIYIGGHTGHSPIYLKRENGEVVGAFLLRRFWPMPLVVLLVMIVLKAEIDGVSTPEWWPILQSIIKPGEGESLQYMLYPVAAGLGYTDLALSSTPREKSSISAVYLGLYSVVLLTMALASEFNSLLVIPGVLFAPIGHEVLILYGKKKEQSKPILYRKEGTGIQFMHVIPKSSASEAGLEKDDIITKINGEVVESWVDFMMKVEQSYFMVFMEGVRKEQPFSVVLKKKPSDKDNSRGSFQSHLRSKAPHAFLHKIADLGLIPVPEIDSLVYMKISSGGTPMWLRNILKKVKGLFNKPS